MFFLSHFLLTIVYVFPANPIKVRFKPFLDRTIGTIFTQNWSLFAPNPVAKDYVMLLQPLQGNQISEVKQGRWYNVSSPFWQRFQNNRFSAYDRLGRSQTNALRSALNGDSRLLIYYQACEKGDSSACKIYEASLKEIREYQLEKLKKIGSAFCNDLDKENFRYFALRLRIVSFPTWSKRNNEKRTFIDLDMGIHAIDKTVEPIGIFN